MTMAECDSTTNNELRIISFEDNTGTHHAHGCTGIGAPCSNSLLRLALTAGSAYALRFTTCIVSDKHPRRSTKRTKRSRPYQRRNKNYSSISVPLTTYEENPQEAQVVSSSTDFNFPEESTTKMPLVEKQRQVDLKRGLFRSLDLDEVQEQLETSQPSLKPLRIISTEKEATAEN